MHAENADSAANAVGASDAICPFTVEIARSM